MVKVITGVFVIVILCCFSLSQAQPASGWGIGISILDAQQAFEIGQTEGAAYNHSITVPIILNQGFRLEPEVGFFNGKSTEEYPAFNETEEYTTTQYRIGIGIFPQAGEQDTC